MHPNFSFARRLHWATGWMAALALTAACGSTAKTDSGDDATADVATDAPADGIAGNDTLTSDTATPNDIQSGPLLVIDNPKANATLSSAGAFTLQAHVQNPPKSGGPFTVKVADAVLARAGNRPIFVAYRDDFLTLKGQCGALIGRLASQRNLRQLTTADGELYYEPIDSVVLTPRS